jgi:hypothetical protein
VQGFLPAPMEHFAKVGGRGFESRRPLQVRGHFGQSKQPAGLQSHGVHDLCARTAELLRIRKAALGVLPSGTPVTSLLVGAKLGGGIPLARNDLLLVRLAEGIEFGDHSGALVDCPSAAGTGTFDKQSGYCTASHKPPKAFHSSEACGEVSRRCKASVEL